MASQPQLIRIQSYNPYESRYSGLRVISRETLNVIKVLRERGYTVIVDPDNGSTLHYSTEKGLREFLSDPIYIVVVGIPISVITNIISSWLYDRFKKVPNKEQVSIVLETDEHGTCVRFDHRGAPITERRFQSILRLFERKAQRYKESQAIAPPDLIRPVPIFLEHTSKLVGWGRVAQNENGFRLDDVQITHKKTLKAMNKGDLEGLSIAALVYDSVCSICGRQYVECNHITGKEYDGRQCVNRIAGILVAETSLVKQPVQPDARIERTMPRKAKRT